MIDLHSHILPGIDDGAPDMAVSLEMAYRYVAEGFSQVVATPHALPEEIGTQRAQALRRQVAEMNRILGSHAIPLTLATGMEIAMAPELSDLLNAGLLLPLADSRYVLIETPFERLPISWEQILFQVAGRGYRVLLAHPERCAQLSRNHAMFDRLMAMGVYLQVNWGSFTGSHGRPAKKTARYLAHKGYIHCLATDSHDHRRRSADIAGKAAPSIEALIGSANLDLLSRENPARVIADRPMATVSRTPTSRRAKGNWIRWIFRQA